MTDDQLPVLWLYGPPGSGKTAVGWEIFSRLSANGVEVGYVDIDQLGICYPAPGADPGRHQMKARNADLVATTFALAGARCVIVSGVVDVVHGLDWGKLPHAMVTACRLRAEPDELRRRLVARGAEPESVEATLTGAAATETGPPAGLSIDTTGLAVSAAADLVCARVGLWPPWATTRLGGKGPRSGPRPKGPPPRVPVLLVCGPTAVGKSAVGWQLYERARRAGLHAAFVDLGQLGFLRPARASDPHDHQVKAANLAALWGTFGAAGAECLVVVGAVDNQDTAELYRRTIKGATVVFCRLHASSAVLAERVMLRGQGRNWPEPGDSLKGQAAASLSAAARKAASEAEDLEDRGLGDVSIDTDGRSVEEVVEAIVTRANGWPRK